MNHLPTIEFQVLLLLVWEGIPKHWYIHLHLTPFTPLFLPSFVLVPFLDQWDHTFHKIHGSVRKT